MTRLADQRGTVTAFVTVLAVALLLTAGLALDGGRVLDARRQANDLAQNAARAGAQAVDLDALRGTPRPVVAGASAQQAARAYLAAAGHPGSVAVAGDTVTVTVTVAVPMHLLGLAGLHSKTVTATQTARIVQGVTAGDT